MVDYHCSTIPCENTYVKIDIDSVDKEPISMDAFISALSDNFSYTGTVPHTAYALVAEIVGGKLDYEDEHAHNWHLEMGNISAYKFVKQNEFHSHVVSMLESRGHYGEENQRRYLNSPEFGREMVEAAKDPESGVAYATATYLLEKAASDTELKEFLYKTRIETITPKPVRVKTLLTKGLEELRTFYNRDVCEEPVLDSIAPKINLITDIAHFQEEKLDDYEQQIREIFGEDYDYTNVSSFESRIIVADDLSELVKEDIKEMSLEDQVHSQHHLTYARDELFLDLAGKDPVSAFELKDNSFKH